MDPIEPVNGSPDPHEGQPPSAPQPTSYPRQRAASLRSRRPSIRLQRLPSFEQANLSTLRSQPSQQFGDSSSRAAGSTLAPLPSIPAASTEDESWQGNRRRSNSEPRPGRWSAPNPAAFARLTTGDQMHPVKEEVSHQSPIAATESSQPPAEDVPPRPEMPRRGSRNPMRWASGVSTNRFTRNRASTVSGSAPAQTEEMGDEYRPHIVDVLDVIGTSPSLTIVGLLARDTD